MIPGSASPLLLAGAAEEAGTYEIERSLRFNSSDSAYLSRTPSVAGNRKTWTWAGWVKRGKLGADTWVLRANSSGSDFLLLGFGSNNQLYLSYTAGLNGAGENYTSAVFRDPSAWYHLACAFDSTQATASNRIKLYVNGVEQALAVSNPPTLNADYQVSTTNEHRIGGFSGSYADFYLADIHFIDGQALTPSSFTEVSATTGQLIPKAYTGTYGTNGFWLKFSDNSAATATTLGKDYSGNSNNWTPNNLSVTAGSGNDSLVDTPTSYGTDTGAGGGEVRGNYCTLNPLANGGALSNGNLDATSGTNKVIYSTIALDSGKYYWEIALNGSSKQQIGIADITKTNTTNSAPGDAGRNGYVYLTSGSIYNNGTLLNSSYASSTTGDVIGVAYDGSSNKLWIRKNNGSWFGGGDPSAGTSPTMTTSTSFIYTPVLGAGGVDAVNASCSWGQRSWAYVAPSGYKALCTTNLPEPTIADGSTAMDVVLDTGANILTAAQGAIGGSADLLWIKDRANTNNHQLIDTVRGGTATLQSNTYAAETTYSAPSGSSVAWCWDSGSSTVTNTQGSITSQVRANASAGFSIVTYTGTGSNATVGHGLNIAPYFVIVKSRSNPYSWIVWHNSFDTAGNTDYLFLENTASKGGLGSYNFWNNTVPTSSVIHIGTQVSVNSSGLTYVAYCFAPVDGYSNGFSYTGNGSADGSFVYLGFRPKLLLIKRSDSTAEWKLLDTVRSSGGNVVDDILYPDGSYTEGSNDGNHAYDFLSNGFKVRATHPVTNASGGTYIGFAWAENPFQYARAR